MKNVCILGAGLIGKSIAADLQFAFAVTCADVNLQALKSLAESTHVKTQVLDVTDKQQLTRFLQPFDIVVCAVPGFLGFETLKHIIEAGKNVVDISFFPENALELDSLAKEKNVTAIVDCGVAPGLCNLIAGYHNAIAPLHFYECLVGGLPQVRVWPYEYKAVFSPIDVIEEYTRPARYVENGKLVEREALSDAELLSFPGVGTLESFNTDGLRSLALTMPHVPDMKEKTLRYPGHISLMRVLRETGFFSKEPIDINGVQIAPIDFTSRLLFPAWKMQEGETDVTVMRVTVKNAEGTTEYNLYDTFDENTNTTSMARTTGYTCTAAVNLLANGLYTKKGISPPELVGADASCFEYVIKYLKERNVTMNINIRTKN